VRDRLPALEGRRCGACDKPTPSELSIAGRCEQRGHDICQACWAIRRVRHCAAHAPASTAVQVAREDLGSRAGVTRAAGTSRAPAPTTRDAAREIARLREEGQPVMAADDARLVPDSHGGVQPGLDHAETDRVWDAAGLSGRGLGGGAASLRGVGRFGRASRALGSNLPRPPTDQRSSITIAPWPHESQQKPRSAAACWASRPS